MATWTLSATFNGSEDMSGLHIFPSNTRKKIFILSKSSASKLYIYDMVLETINEISLQQYTSHGMTYTPNSRWLYNPLDDNLYCAEWLMVLGVGNAGQVFRVNPIVGNLTLLMDTLDAFNTPERSVSGNMDLAYFGDAFYLFFSENVPGHSEDKIVIVRSFGGDGYWQGVYNTPPDPPHDPGDYPLWVLDNVISHEGRLAAFYENLTGTEINILYGPDNWHVHQNLPPGGTIVPTWGSGYRFYRENLSNIYYIDDDDFSSETLYKNYINAPQMINFPYSMNQDGDPIVSDQLGGNLWAYYGGSSDMAVVGMGGCSHWRTCVTMFGAYGVSQDNAPGSYVKVYKVSKDDLRTVAIPVGIDISPDDSEIYLTGTTFPGMNPLMIEYETATMASGIGCISTGSGWVYPHAASKDFVYLYGYLGPDSKCALYEGSMGVASGILTGLDAHDYISGLRTDPYYGPLDVYFSIVNSGGGGNWLGSSEDGGASWTNELNTPWPTRSLHRTFLLSEALLASGEATFVGASGCYSCPVKKTDDLASWDNRCDGLPSTTVTEIDNA